MQYIKAVAAIEKSHLPVFRPIEAMVSHNVDIINTSAQNSNIKIIFPELKNVNSTIASDSHYKHLARVYGIIKNI